MKANYIESYGGAGVVKFGELAAHRGPDRPDGQWGGRSDPGSEIMRPRAFRSWLGELVH